MASTRKRGTKYMGLYRDADGNQRSAGSYPTQKAAKAAAVLAEAGVMPVKTEAAMPAKIRGKATVASYAMEWFPAHPMAPHTAYVYEQVLRKHIIPAVGGRVLADVTSADIRAYFRTLEKAGTSKALLAKIKTVLSRMFQTACEDRRIPYNPVRGVKFQAVPPKRRRALTADEWRRVRKYLTNAAADVIARAVAKVAPGTSVESSAPVAAIEARDLLADIGQVLGDRRAKLADLPARLRKLAPGWGEYRTLAGVQLRDLFDAEGVRTTNTGNVLRVYPADVRRVLAERSAGGEVR